MTLNRELIWMCKMLTEHGVKFWIDSGTLLGLAREGGIMEDDHDIDLSMWSDSEPLLEEIIPEVENSGYRVSIRNYRGLNFKYKFMPSFKESSLDIDISLFRREGDYAWCPQVYCMPYPIPRRNPAYYLYALPRKAIQEIFIRKRRVVVNLWPWSLSYKFYTVLIPKIFFEEPIWLRDGIPAPKAYREYLTYRYGNWKIPRKDWFFINDDGAIKHDSPEAVIEKIKR